jgi:hypothetical protein
MKTKKAARGSNGFVNVKVSSGVYAKAQAQVAALQKEATEKMGYAVKVSVVIERVLNKHL